MTNETFDMLEAAIASGTINEQEVLDLISRGRQRAKQVTLDAVSKALDDGVKSEDVIADVEARRR